MSAALAEAPRRCPACFFDLPPAVPVDTPELFECLYCSALFWQHPCGHVSDELHPSCYCA